MQLEKKHPVVRVNLTLPEDILARFDETIGPLNMSRSEAIATLIRAYLAGGK